MQRALDPPRPGRSMFAGEMNASLGHRDIAQQLELGGLRDQEGSTGLGFVQPGPGGCRFELGAHARMHLVKEIDTALDLLGS